MTRSVNRSQIPILLFLGTTDYMDRFIDEQDPTREAPAYHSLLFGMDAAKKSQNCE